MHILEIKIKDNNIFLVLKKSGEVLDNLKWKDGSSLSRDLLSKIDGMLAKNRINSEDVKLEVASDMPENFTPRRIAEAVANTWNFTVDKFA